MLTAGHLTGIRAHPKQARHQGLLADGSLLGPLSWAAVSGAGVVAVGGICDIRVSAGWLLFTDKITPASFIAVWRAARRAIDVARRAGEGFVVHVDPDYPEALRLAELLGLTPEGKEVVGGRMLLRMST